MFLTLGLVIGVAARLLLPGRAQGGWSTSIILGVAGSLGGGLLGGLMGLGRPGLGAEWVMSVLGAVAMILVYDAMMRG
ncbi:MAG: GlsB/YeaQ/YmgE family stress response membrane protein [Polyangiaceae bacterium]